MSLKNFQLPLTTFLAIIMLTTIVLAVPIPPHRLYGYVTVNGQPASDGTTVVAKINSVQVASTTTSDGKYGYNPIFYVEDTDPSSRAGKTINFFVNGVDTGQFSYFCSGCSYYVNLSVQIAQPSPPPSGGGSTGGGGGGGGGGVTPSTSNGGERVVSGPSGNTSINICQERWLCSSWSECENGIQTRTCNDESNCGTNNNEPMTSQPCSKVIEEIPPRTLPITSMIIATITNPLYGGIFAVVLAGILYTVFRFVIKKKKS